MALLCSRCRYIGEGERCPLCEGEMRPAEALLTPLSRRLKLVRREPPQSRRGRWTTVLRQLLIAALLALVVMWMFPAVAALLLFLYIHWAQQNEVLGAIVTTVAAGTLCGGTIALVKYYRFRRQPRPGPRLLAAVIPPPLPSATQTTGKVQRLEHEVRGPLSGRPGVAAVVHVRALDGLARARTIVTADFIVLLDSGESILITGTGWLEAAMPTSSTQEKGEVRALVERLGLSAEHFGADTAEEVLLVDGDRVEVQGEAHREHVATAGAYRGGEMLVVRGKPGAPVLLRRC